MDDRGAGLKWGQSILKHPSVSTVVTERQREGPPPLQTPMCPSGKHICLSLSLWQAISWWASLHDEWSPFHSFIIPLNHVLTCFGDQPEAAFCTLPVLKSCEISLSVVRYFLDHLMKPHLCSLCLSDFTSWVDPHWPSRVFPWVMCIVWLSYLSTSAEHISI